MGLPNLPWVQQAQFNSARSFGALSMCLIPTK